MSSDRIIKELRNLPVDDLKAANLIDDYYTECKPTDEDKPVLERFLQSRLLDVRYEALIALSQAGNFTGYATDALIVHLLGFVEDDEAAIFGGSSMLAELCKNGDREACRIVESLKMSEKWRRIVLNK